MTSTITAAMDRDTLTRGAQVPPAGTRDPAATAGVSPGNQSAPPAAGTGVFGVTVQGAAAANGIGAMGTTTWGTGCRRGAGGTRVVEVRGVVVAMVMGGVAGIREVPQDWKTGDGITEVPLLESGIVAEVLLEVRIVVEVLEVGITEELLLEVGKVAEVLLEVGIIVEVLEVGIAEELHLEFGIVVEVRLEVGMVVEVLEVGIAEELHLEVGKIAEVLLEIGIVVEVLEVGIIEGLLLEVGKVAEVLEVGTTEEVLMEVGTVAGDLLGAGIIEVLLAVGTVVAALLVARTAEDGDGTIEALPTVGIAEVFLAVGTIVEILVGEAPELVDGTTGVLLQVGGGTTEEVGEGGLPVGVLLGGMIGDQAGVLAGVEVRDGILDMVEGGGMAMVEVVLREAGVTIEAMHQGGTMEEVEVEVIGAAGVPETGEEIPLHQAAALGEIEGEFQGLSFLRSCKERKWVCGSPCSCLLYSYPHS